MRQGTSKARVSVLIERPDGSIYYRDWTGSSVKRIRAAARAKYADCRVSFGRAVWINSYGAH